MPDSDETEEGICERCGAGPMEVEFGDVPTPLCHNCAHEIATPEWEQRKGSAHPAPQKPSNHELKLIELKAMSDYYEGRAIVNQNYQDAMREGRRALFNAGVAHGRKGGEW